MLEPALTWAGLLLGLAGLVLQFTISISDMLANGRDLPGALGVLFAYYTILTNIILVLIYLSEVTPAGWLGLFRRPLVRGAMAANIALVGLYVYFVLRYLSDLHGPWFVADAILHYAAPLLYLVWWVATQKHGVLRWANLPLMLLPTLIYFFYAMARGAWVQEYPYPILNAVELGYGQVVVNALYMTVFLAALSLAVIAADKFLARYSRTSAP
ncbi:Pr6Pr family membrane protein [Devosia rhizoryzae]|uniref:Pr6Pr family membrane protein n=1 Tax=Devosia rhizoryzae TaxID=2774137 RepID=A0ABX7C7S4_9HYPH|nr:Pr6Pr family membrane protein [Devosia rhizoryzae]QQR40325.1 Pr6Pr family membrane protein [Devosia rhizoryzae]